VPPAAGEGGRRGGRARPPAPPPRVTPTDRTCPSGMTGPVGARGRPVSRRRLICGAGGAGAVRPPRHRHELLRDRDQRDRPAEWYHISYRMPGGAVSVTASEARQRLFPLIEEVNADQVAVEIVSPRIRRAGFVIASEIVVDLVSGSRPFLGAAILPAGSGSST